MDLKLAATIGAASRRARTGEGLTQADVAEAVGLATEVYGRLERGKMLPSVPTLRKIATALSIPSDRMLGLTSSEGHRAAETASPALRDPPELRRLIRRLRRLDRRRLRIVSLLAAELGRTPAHT